MLYDVLRFRAEDPGLNDLSGAMALMVAPLATDLRVAHIWSERNLTCDRSSRMAINGVHGTEELSGVTRSRPAKLTAESSGREWAYHEK